MDEEKRKELLNRCLSDQKVLMARFYDRISGRVAWYPGERKVFADGFARLDRQIDGLQPEVAADWFASLPDAL